MKSNHLAMIMMILFLATTANAVEPWTVRLDEIDSTHTSAVIAAVTVLDANREGVLGLDSTHFNVIPEGYSSISPRVQSFYESDQGVAVVLCLDASLSMSGDPMADAKEAVNEYIDQLRPQDRVAIITFGDEVEIVSDFSMNRSYLKERTGTIQARGATTELFYGVYRSLTFLDESTGIPDRRLVLVLSDGKNESMANAYSLDNCIEKANENDVPIFTVGFTNIDERFLRNLEAMSDRTNGQYHRARESEDLSEQFVLSLDYLKSQYLLSFNPPSELADGRSHSYTIAASRGNFAGQTVLSMAVSTRVTADDGHGGRSDSEFPFIPVAAGGAVVVIVVVVIALVSSRNRAKRREEEQRLLEEERRRQEEEHRLEEKRKQQEAEAAKLKAEPVPESDQVEAGSSRDTGIPSHTSVAGQAPAQSMSRKTIIGQPALQVYKSGSFLISSGSQAGSEFDVTAAEVTIGAADDNRIVLEEPTVSGHHATLRFVGGQFQLTDNDSTNGTRVNGEQIHTVLLNNGDRIQMGRCELQFQGVQE